MAVSVKMPRFGWQADEMKVIEWLKKQGDPVEKGDALMTAECEKFIADVEAPSAGILAQLVVAPGSVVPCGNVVAIIAEASEELQAGPRVDEEAAAPAAQIAVPTISATPIARRIAEEKGIDLSQVRATGRGGRVTESDVLEHLQAQGATSSGAQVGPHPARVIPLTGMRHRIAQNLTQSLQSMAQLTLTREVDVTQLVGQREKLKAQFSLSYTDLIIRAVALALKKHPLLNATLVGEEIRLFDAINVGVAVALEGGLTVPVIRNAERLSLREIAQERDRVAKEVRESRPRADLMTGGTFTVSNLGNHGIDAFTPIINLPEVAILGVGRIVEKPVIHQGEIAKRSMMTLSLTIDHRIVDGAPGAEFLATLAEILMHAGSIELRG